MQISLRIADRSTPSKGWPEEALSKLQQLVQLLIAEEPLDEKYRDHSLTGNWADSRDCHIEPNWLLIYRIADSTLYLDPDW